ncbi:hypothetical protein [Paraburkholderia sp. 32]|uniref:hypothetical protein n=1 Tax=Paraburkholderia sp. 32 TaxID=2991057 RepID=UPI003D1C1C9B
MSNVKQATNIPLLAGALYVNNAPILTAHERLLRHYMSERSWLVHLSFQDRFEVAEDAPGYLRTFIKTRAYYVPNHLVPLFPTVETLGFIDPLVDCLRLNSESSFCLSGSGMFLGQVMAIADLDFCEYYTSNRNALEKNILTKIKGSKVAPLVVVKANGNLYRLPFLELKQLIDEGKFLRNIGKNDIPMKFDFIASMDNLGGIAASNIVLPVNKKINSKNVELSWQFQEAVIFDDKSKPKRQLFDPAQLGKYIAWLLAQARHYINLSKESSQISTQISLCVKALKRLMSLFLVVELPAHWDQLLKTLQRSEMMHIVLQARANALDELIHPLPNEIGAELIRLYA